MKLVVISHKLCQKAPNAPDVYQTDGGFPLQIRALSELFDETRLVVPCEKLAGNMRGVTTLSGRNLSLRPLTAPLGAGLRRKLIIPLWLIRNGGIIWGEVRRADAVHAPIPGDVGTIGLLFAIIQRKPLFVRHCGNFSVPRTVAEKFWKWTMENFGGGRNVMLATGGSDAAPSAKNANIKWIFSTSLSQKEISGNTSRSFPSDGKFKLFTACRLEERKGVETVIESFSLIVKKFPAATLEIVGGGSLAEKLKSRAAALKLTDKITFHGKVEPKKVIDLMKQAHVFCYPTQASEGFPKVVLEALACGLPVITTKVSVLPQLIGKDCGFLLDAPTAENLAAALENIFTNAEKYNQMSERARAAAKDYSLENWRDLIGETLKKSWRVGALSTIPKTAIAAPETTAAIMKSCDFTS